MDTALAPTMPSTTPLSEDGLEAIRRRLDREEPAPTLGALAAASGLSAPTLLRRFRARYGVSPAEYARQRRLARFKQALRKGESVTEAVYSAGYGAPSRVYERSDALLGMPPARYARGAVGEHIRYTLIDCALGRALVAVTARGVCAVSVGDDDARLERELATEFPRARRERVDAGRGEFLAPLVGAIAARLAGAQAAPVPLDLRASAFQWRVWQALLNIPRGQTRSYAQIAAELGAPRAARAVARACAGNRVAALVPCHRVVRSDGSLGGYRWGLPAKAELLARERR